MNIPSVFFIGLLTASESKPVVVLEVRHVLCDVERLWLYDIVTGLVTVAVFGRKLLFRIT